MARRKKRKKATGSTPLPPELAPSSSPAQAAGEELVEMEPLQDTDAAAAMQELAADATQDSLTSEVAEQLAEIDSSAPQSEQDTVLQPEPAVAETEKQKKKKARPPRERKQTGVVAFLRRHWFLFANMLYAWFYYVGIQLLRSTRIRRRRFMQQFQQMEKVLEQRNQVYRQRLIEWCKARWAAFTAPLDELRLRQTKFRLDLANAKRYGKPQRIRRVYLDMAGFILRGFWNGFRFLFNYLAPVAAIAFFIMQIQHYENLTFALRVEYAGKDLGYVRNESVFSRAESEMKGRIINETYIKPDDVIPRFTLSIVDKDDLISTDQLTDKLIQASGNELKEAYGLYIENHFVSAVTDGNALLLHLNSLLERHRTPEMSPQDRIQFVKKVQLKPKGLYPVSSVRPLEEVKQILEGEEKGEKRYTVVEGDDGLTIAAKNGIPYRDLKALNPHIEERLFIGDEVIVSQSVPFLGVQVTTTHTYEEEIDYRIEQKTDASRNIGYTRVVQAGSKGLRRVTEEVVLVDGVEKERTVIRSEELKAAVPQIVVVGGNRPLAVIPSTSSGSIGAGAFGWPTDGRRIYPGFMGYAGHTGADISWPGCFGAPIYASADGTVVAAGWGGLYGYRVIINHGAGVQTLYAHASKLYVSVGQQVSRGQTIAAIGRTGNSTGPHLHFEIRINGTPRNPAPYLYG